jgi:hypothetical protein
LAEVHFTSMKALVRMKKPDWRLIPRQGLTAQIFNR